MTESRSDVKMVGQFIVFAGMALSAAGAADVVRVSADFTTATGAVKPLHAVNNAPARLNAGAKVWEFEAAGIPYMRTHDTMGAWGGGHYVDVPNVFPDFDADENDPANYDFAFTDAYLAAVVAAGTKVYYRLGVTIENNFFIKAYNIHPPKDFAKWARICEHIVRHCNEGWANGHHWNIEYWEIWNEPENPPMWTGTREQYFELYRVAANHLKSCFPKIKVGGYGGCGFYAVDDAKSAQDAFKKSFVTWFEDFCKYVTDPKTRAPLDFYSWHMYICEKTPHRIVTHANYVRKTLDAAGLTKTESHFNEWNYVGPGWNDFWSMRHARGAAMFAQAFCLMQTAPVDLAMYYDACPTRTYCGLFDLVSKTGDTRTATWFAFRMWNQLYRLGSSCASAADADDFGVSAARGADGGKALVLANNSDRARTVDLSLKGVDGDSFEVFLLDDEHDSGKSSSVDVRRTFVLAPYMTALVATPSKAEEKVDRGVERKVFAGQDAAQAQ